MHFRVFGLRVDNEEHYFAVAIVVKNDFDNLFVRKKPCNSFKILLISPSVRDLLPRLKLIVDEAHEIETAARHNDEIILDANIVASFDR